MWDTIGPWAAGGGIGVLLWFTIAMVKIAVAAERGRADDWRGTAKTREAANEVMSTNVQKLIASVEQLAASQREILALVKSLATDRRNAA